ncbi:hypothetical protein C4565_01850 [Candidatus Parcubacteria bacterium]|jgi:hypothetical protein|nr:MAG: hypothetical protein C4565_01850 [Candidatus Parcubacteria bacterium]
MNLRDFFVKRAIVFFVFVVIGVGVYVLFYGGIKQEEVGGNVISGFNNPSIEQAIEEYLLTQKNFSWKTKENGHRFCTVENLLPEQQLFPLYVWSYCGEYTLQDGALTTLSGSSGPIKIDYPNELSFYDMRKFSHEAPRDGSYYTPDVKRIFPEGIWDRIFHFSSTDNITNLVKKAKQEVFTTISGWDRITRAIAHCEVKEVFQAHSRNVSARLKNGEVIVSVEPNIDDIIRRAVDAENTCGRIIMATE